MKWTGRRVRKITSRVRYCDQQRYNERPTGDQINQTDTTENNTKTETDILIDRRYQLKNEFKCLIVHLSQVTCLETFVFMSRLITPVL